MAYRRQRKRSAMSLALEQKMNVMNAVMLRDMRTRFFNHGLGFLVQSFWPLAHIFMLIVIYNLAGRTAAYGDSVTLFFATALLPTMSFMYISRFMCLSLILNRQMLSFPAVKIVDIMFARAFLEIMAAFLTLFLTIVILLILGDNPFPADPIQAVLAYLTSLLLGVGRRHRQLGRRDRDVFRTVCDYLRVAYGCCLCDIGHSFRCSPYAEGNR